MPTRFGADGGFASTTSGGVFDGSGNPIISADNQFGGVPLGPAALAQTLFSVANGTFNILPPDIDLPISNENPLPYWSTPIDNSDGEMTAQVVFDTTSNTYSLRMDPGSALSGDTLSITTRSAVISDDNLSLRQKAIATLAKVGTYAGTTQVNLKLDATYYDHTGTQLSTNAIGTVFDNGTVSSITGFTTAGTAIVGVSAAYVDLTFTMTATANVTSGIAFDIDTILLQTSQGGGGGAQSFIITDTFTSSGTWTRPTGVDALIAVIAVGAGGGGGGGQVTGGIENTFTEINGGAGGGGARWAMIRDVNVAGVATVSVGIGAGGTGGTAGSTLAKTGTTVITFTGGGNGGNGSAGGTTTFGTYLSVPGGGGGEGGNASGNAVGTAGGSATTPLWPGTPFGQVGAGAGGSSRGASPTGAGGVNTYPTMPYTPSNTNAGTAGGSATISGGTAGTTIYTPGAGGTAGSVGYSGGGGAGVAVFGTGDNTAGTYKNGGGGGGGGGGAGAKLQTFGTAVVFSGTAGTGGNPGANTGAGGGGGGAIVVYGSSATSGTAKGGSVNFRTSRGTIVGAAGAPGAAGAVFVIYVG